MALNNIEEQLRVAEHAHRVAGAGFDGLYQALLEEQTKEAKSGRELEKAYNAAFAGGIIIERVTQPEDMTYMAGIREVIINLFESDDEPEWLELDEAHASKLAGAFATEVTVHLRPCRSIERADNPQSTPSVNFSVQGRTVETPDNLYLLEMYEGATEYSGELAAIEWRLPTPAEIQAFGATATAAA